MAKYLTPAERETVILMDDGSDQATITTHQSKILTKLSRNPNAVLIEDGSFGSTKWASYTIPANLISIRVKSRVGQRKGITPECAK